MGRQGKKRRTGTEARAVQQPENRRTKDHVQRDLRDSIRLWNHICDTKGGELSQRTCVQHPGPRLTPGAVVGWQTALATNEEGPKKDTSQLPPSSGAVQLLLFLLVLDEMLRQFAASTGQLRAAGQVTPSESEVCTHAVSLQLVKAAPTTCNGQRLVCTHLMMPTGIFPEYMRLHFCEESRRGPAATGYLTVSIHV